MSSFKRKCSCKDNYLIKENWSNCIIKKKKKERINKKSLVAKEITPEYLHEYKVKHGVVKNVS